MAEMTNDEIARRLGELRLDLKSCVDVATWENWRRDSYGQRMDGLEAEFRDMRREADNDRKEADRRYRNAVNLAVGLVVGFLGNLGLAVLQLVHK